MKEITANYLRELSMKNSTSIVLLNEILSHCHKSAIRNEYSTNYYFDMEDSSSDINKQVIDFLIERGFNTSVFDDYQERCYTFSVSWN